MTLRTIKILAILAITALIAACGGGGGGGGGDGSSSPPPVTPITRFALYPSDFLSEGYQEYYELVASDTFGGTGTGRLSRETRAQTIFNGESAIPIDNLFSLTQDETGEIFTTSGTTYYSTSLDDLRRLGDSSTDETTTIPRTAEIGDFGDVGTYFDDDGDRRVVTWDLADGGDGKAILTFATNITDQFGNYDSTTEEAYVINSSGERLSIEILISSPDFNGTLTLTGDNSR